MTSPVKVKKGTDETWARGQRPLEGSMDFGVIGAGIQSIFAVSSSDLEQVSSITFLRKFPHQ